jgi:type VI secretion system protein VasI
MNRYCREFAAAVVTLIAGVAAAQPAGKWAITVGEDPSSYEVLASLQQDAANTIKDEYATKDVAPQLAFRCAPGNPEISARIDWRRFISSFNTEVGFKVDGGETLWLKWGVDQSNNITVSKSAADSQSLVDLLDGGSELLVEVSPYAESPVTVRFDLAGFSQALDALRMECQ